MFKKIIRVTFLVIYYSFLIFLPSNSVCKFCVKLRGACLKYIFNSIGSNVNIASGVRFGSGSLISIGDNSGLGERNYLVCMAPIKIGNDVMIAPEVMFLTGGHEYNDPAILLIHQPSVVAPISIGNDCWIGARAIILPGVCITNRVIIAAGSVVTKNISESGIYGGNPVRKIKDI